MNIEFENLNKITEILDKLDILESKINGVKRWLNTEETSQYLGYSKESINSMVKSQEFINGIHYHQRFKKRMFDRILLDKWVLGEDRIDVENSISYKINSTIKNITDELKSSL